MRTLRSDFRSSLFLVIGLPGVAGGAEVPTTALVAAPEELAIVRASFVEQVGAEEVPSLSVGVVRGGQIVWAEGIGWADREGGRPATVESVYPVASVSKSITATGALALVAQGRLALDRSVHEVLGEAALRGPGGPAGRVLVSHLLAHSSGIPHRWHYEYRDRPGTVLGRAGLIAESGFVVAPPGERTIYTNLGYGVLAEVMERTGGEPFQEVMTSVLFAPLGMRSTTVDGWVGADGAVTGYDVDGAPIAGPYRLAPDGGAGFFSSVADLLHYSLYHLGTPEKRDGSASAAPVAEASIVAALTDHRSRAPERR
jgi:CubicO group peptidase (beta-lactamase class C family)